MVGELSIRPGSAACSCHWSDLCDGTGWMECVDECACQCSGMKECFGCKACKALPKPYYDGDGITVYHGDCREILPTLPNVDLVLTDPPYPSYYTEEYHYSPDLILLLDRIPCRQFVFWTPSCAFPLNYGGKRIWDKGAGTCTQFEEIYERNNSSGYILHRVSSAGCFSSVGEQMTGEIMTGHPSQKPLRLIAALIRAADCRLILDPFMGSGSTLVAAHRLGRRAIGIEIEEKYCEIAAKRLENDMPLFSSPAYVQGELFAA